MVALTGVSVMRHLAHLIGKNGQGGQKCRNGQKVDIDFVPLAGGKGPDVQPVT